MVKCNINPSTLSLEWPNICRELSPQQAVRLLHRFTSGLLNLFSNGDKIPSDSYINFLEKRVIYDYLDGKRLLNSQNLSFSKSLNILHYKIIELNHKSLLKPKDVSLSLNSYAKFYQNLNSNRNYSYLFSLFSTEQIKNYVSQLLDIANNTISSMNEQDLSLVLNCISKINIKHDEFLKSSNKLLYNSLQEFYRFGLSLVNAPKTGNLIQNITPQGVSLVLNCFSKFDVELNNDVLSFFVDEYVPKLANRFLINQLIVSLNAFLKFKVPLDKVSKTIKISDKMLNDSQDEYTTKLISTALYTFAKYNYFPTISFTNIISYLKRTNLKHCSELELGNIYYALGKLNILESELIDKMNEIVMKDIKKYTPHGVVGIFHSLSKLDYKKRLLGANKDYETMEKTFISEFLKFYEDKSSITSVVPLHNINFCFSCAINTNLDDKIYSYILNKLTCMIKDEPSLANVFNNDNILLNYREELTSQQSQFRFLSKYIGIQGIYQLYCILQHMLNYVKGSLETIPYSVLSSLNSLIDHFHIISNTSKKRFFTEEVIFNDNGNVDEISLDEKTNITSKTHEEVYSTIANVIKPAIQDSNDHRKLENDSQSVLYKEYETLPYTIDIVLFKF